MRLKIAFCRVGTNADERADDCLTVITPLCEANSGDPLCPDDSPDTITGGDWSRSFAATPLNTAPDPDDLKSEFLQIEGNTIDTGELQIDVNSMLFDPFVYSMDFSTELFDGLAIGGDADSGFTYFNGRTALDDTLYHFAGIYGSTDLGAPLTLDNNLSATWNGRVQLGGFPADFVLNVGFDGTDGTGTLDGFIVNYTRIPDFPDEDVDILIDGTFDENGLISGTVTSATFEGNVKTGEKRGGVNYIYEADLTGIIGQEGAVGVFVHKVGSPFRFAGGFIAGPDIAFNPDVIYSDWTRSFTTTPLNYDPTAASQFLHTTGNVISVGVENFFTSTPSKQSLDFSAFTSGGVSLGLSADDGLAYFQGEVQAGNTYAYAGIYETTDLGAPITDSSFSAAWDGKYDINGGAGRGDFTLNVAFTGTSGTINAFIIDANSTSDFLIEGTFDENGVITGKTHFAMFDNDDSATITDRDGILSGLIGQEGAVGVIYGTGFNIGGFIASPAVTICAKDVFNTDCPVNTDVSVQTAFCLNTVANEGKNPFHAMCNTDGTTHGDVNGARDTTCFARGDMADDTCKSRANVLTACDMDAYRQTTGLGGSNTNLCTGMSVDLADTYSNLRLECEKSDVGSFADYCDSQDLIGAVDTARNDYCVAKLTDLSEASGQGNCVSRLDAICITNPTAPFAGICGTGITAGQIMACEGTISDLTDKGAMASDCNDDDLSGAICGDTNSMGGTNPFAEICSDDMAIISGFDKDKAQLEACKGALNTLPANNSCASPGLSGMICGNDASESGSNPFAPICESPTQNENYLNRVASRQISCGNDRLGALDANKGNCDTLQDGLCDTAVKSLSATMRGEGNFVCSTDDGPTVVLLRNNYCEDPATTYNDVVGCRNAEGNNDGEVRKVRKQLGVDCVKGNTKNDASLHADCQKTVNGAITVEDCSANPYRNECIAGELLNEFADVTTARNALCTTSVSNSDPFHALCNVYPMINTQRVDYCDEDTTAWEGRCLGGSLVDTGNAIANARANVCIKNLAIITTAGGGDTVAAGSSLFNILCNGLMDSTTAKTVMTARDTACTEQGADGAGANNDCVNRANVRLLCDVNPFTKPTVNVSAELCTGTNPNGHNNNPELDSAARTRICETPETTFDPGCGTQNKYGSNTNTVRNAVCHANPFDTNCAGDYLVEDTDKLVFCRDGVRNPAGKAGGCATTTTLIMTACGRNPGDPVCADDDATKVTAGDWTRAQPALLNTAPGPKNQFLAIAGNEISTEGTAAAAGDGFGDPSVFTLDFSDFTYGGVSLAGLSDGNGLAHFFGHINLVASAYAGIFGSTDLGAPIADNGLRATWAGKFQFGSDSKDFDLKVTFNTNLDGTGTVDGFIKNFTGGFDFLIAGEFDAKGVITGDVHLANFMNDVQTDIADGDHNGILSGIIGQDGAVGVFYGTSGYSGGFVASAEATRRIATACAWDSGDPICPDDDVAKVTAKDWQRGQPAPLRTYPTAEDQFLKIAGNQISTEETTSGASSTSGLPPIPRPLDFSAFTYGGASLGLSDDDGLAYFQGYIGNTFYEYAGIFGSTDLGAPITTSGFSATWAAKLHFTNVAVKDFNLTVTFNGTTATGTVDGFLVDIVSTFDLLIDGEFDANGVISGKVHYADFTNNLPTATADRNGTLSGIIGAEGAVGAFYKQTGTSYVGGFIASAEATRLIGICETNVFDVACPVRAEPAAIKAFCRATNSNDPRCPTVTAKDWVDSFTNPALNVDSSDLAVKRQFVQIPGKTLSAEGVTRDTRLNSGIAPVHTLDFGSMGLDDDDGLTWVRGSRHHTGSPVSYAYVAIYGTTDLGAPITESGFSATWPAKLQVGGLSAVDFDLTVTFDGRAGTGTLYAFLVNFANSFDFLIDGEFDENGLITGDAHFAQFNGNVPTGTADRHGALSGIIGRDGVVGVFLSRESTVSERIPNSFDGGFVAASDTVNTGDWLSSFTSPALRTTLTPGSKFLQLSGKTINTSGTLTGFSGLGVTPTATTLDFTAFSFDIASGLDDNDGVAHFFGWIGNDLYSYAGIYESTNLGAPITESGFSATWAGKLQVTSNSKDFDLKVTFGGTTGTVKAFIPNIEGVKDLSINGRFGANGVITGNVHFAGFASETSPATPTTFNGTLSGIIGSGGAVGGFYGLSGPKIYSGGFVAVPPPPVVDADDWVSSFTSTLSTTPTAKNQFLQIAGKTISDTAVGFTKSGPTPTLDFSEFTYGGESLVGLDDDNGLAHFQGSFVGTLYQYVGIFGTTDLGARITNDIVSATWAGKFRISGASVKDFTLAVTFGGTTGTGTVDGFITNVSSGTRLDFLIDGEFDANGVITGNVHFAGFASETSPATPTTFNGTLSGIIGSGGAVGGFYGLSGPKIYSGGFVAVPPPPVVDADDWLSSFTSTLSTTPTAKNQFLQIAGKTISDTAVGFTKSGPTPTLDFSEFTYGGESLVGLDDDNGLAHFQGSFVGTLYQYVGIFGTTDLGARITNDIVSATWAGKFRISGASVKDFTLAVTFGGTTGAVDGFLIDVKQTLDFLIDGEFDANGVITGDVHFAGFASETNPTPPTTFNGTLSGIIGSGGAVGVFHSAAVGGYSGGFVAVPPPPSVDADDWVSSFTSPPLDTKPDTTTGKHQFLQIADKTISTSGTRRRANGAAGEIPLVRTLDFSAFSSAIPLGLDDDDGLAYFRGWITDRHSYAGIYASTDLGAPITESGMNATWPAKLGFNAFVIDFNLAVTFDGTTGTVEADIQNVNRDAIISRGIDFSINGRFDANGVITGKVHYDSATHPASPNSFNGTLSGIIGQDGAVGVFVLDSGSNAGTNGGFIAAPAR